MKPLDRIDRPITIREAFAAYFYFVLVVRALMW